MKNTRWDTIVEQFDCFWRMESDSTPCIAVTAPKAHNEFYPARLPEPASLEEKWTNEDYRYKNEILSFESTFYGGCAFPNAISNLGPGVISACIGSPSVFGEDTVWFDTDPIIKNWDDSPALSLDEDNLMWKKLRSLTELFSSRAQNAYFCGISDIGGNLDILAALRGSSNLLTDLFDYPDRVKESVSVIEKIWEDVFFTLYNIINNKHRHCSTWMPLLSDKPWYPLQCDFSSMISPAMFREFAVPALREEAHHLSRSIFHLDGPGELPHLDTILEIPEINGIQWVPGAKMESLVSDERYYDLADEEWIPVYKKIQSRGKCLVLMNARPLDAERLLSKLSPAGLFISTSCDSQKEAEELLELVF